MKKIILVIFIVSICVVPSYANLGAFEIAKELSDSEWIETKKKDKELRQQIDFESLRLFISKQSIEKGTIIYGSGKNQIRINLAEYIPQKEWTLHKSRQLSYHSEKWNWNHGKYINASFYLDGFSVFWSIDVINKHTFKIIYEEIEHERDVLY